MDFVFCLICRILRFFTSSVMKKASVANLRLMIDETVCQTSLSRGARMNVIQWRVVLGVQDRAHVDLYIKINPSVDQPVDCNKKTVKD